MKQAENLVRGQYEQDGYVVVRDVLDSGLVREAGVHMPFRGCEHWTG